MKFFFLYRDLSEPSDVWQNAVWPHLNVLSECCTTDQLSYPDTQDTGRYGEIVSRFVRLRAGWSSGSLSDRVTSRLDRKGPNILFVMALNYRHVMWATALHRVWHHFDARILVVNDTIDAEHIPTHVLQRFDRITCLGKEQSEEFERRSGVRTLVWQGCTDVLNFHSNSDYRPIDLMVVGRRDWELCDPLHRHFNAKGRNRIFLDFVTRTQKARAPAVEFELLMATYARSKAVFCFDPSRVPRFKGKSPLLGRWAHSWAAGCTIFGKAPAEMFDGNEMIWPGAVIDIPTVAQDAIEVIEETLSDAEGIWSSRNRNVIGALRHCDIRIRLAQLLHDLSLPFPNGLKDGLHLLEKNADKIERALQEGK